MTMIENVFNNCINCLNVPDEEELYKLYCKLNNYDYFIEKEYNYSDESF